MEYHCCWDYLFIQPCLTLEIGYLHNTRCNLVEFMTKVEYHIITQNGVVINKSFGKMNLAYDINKWNGCFPKVNMWLKNFKTLNLFLVSVIDSFLCSCFQGIVLGFFIERASNHHLIAWCFQGIPLGLFIERASNHHLIASCFQGIPLGLFIERASSHHLIASCFQGIALGFFIERASNHHLIAY